MQGVAELIHLSNVASFLTGRVLSLFHGIDAPAAKGIMLRHGAGTLKHLDIRQLWVQAAISDYRITITKINRESNLADFLCSPGSESDLRRRLSEFQCTSVIIP